MARDSTDRARINDHYLGRRIGAVEYELRQAKTGASHQASM